MIDSLDTIIHDLLPLLRSFCTGDYGIALGGAHAKGVDDPESDIDLYIFARNVLPTAERGRLCEQYSERVSEVFSWGQDADFEQGGTDFRWDGKKVEVWLRSSDLIARIIGECQQGIVRRDFVVWTVMGFFNHCTLSDVHKMHLLDDPSGLLAGWQAHLHIYPPLMRERILSEYLAAANFWPANFHYKSAVERCDVFYTQGIVQQVVYNLVQVVFALNESYFPGEKKIAISLERLPLKPVDFTERLQRLIFPETRLEKSFLDWQRQELLALVGEVGDLVRASR